VFERTTRAVREEDADWLREQIREVESEIRSVPKTSLGCLGFLAIGALAVYLSDPLSPVNRWGAVFMLFVYALIAAASAASSIRDHRRQIDRYEDALARGSVVEVRIASKRCVKLVDGEEEDEGEAEAAEYLFALGETGTVAVYGWLDEGFPNSDFTVRRIFDSQGRSVYRDLRCNGEPLVPERVFNRDAMEDPPEYEECVVMPDTFEERIRELERAQTAHTP
jgi:hypothetical protein